MIETILDISPLVSKCEQLDQKLERNIAKTGSSIDGMKTGLIRWICIVAILQLIFYALLFSRLA